MNKTIILSILATVLITSIANAIPTGVELPDEVWQNNGIWDRFHPDKEMKTRLLERFGGKIHEQIIQELYLPPQPFPLKQIYRTVPASIRTVGEVVTINVSGQDDCKNKGLKYCSYIFSKNNKHKCAISTKRRCARLQPFYD